jgi:hypothetical protein
VDCFRIQPDESKFYFDCNTPVTRDENGWWTTTGRDPANPTKAGMAWGIDSEPISNPIISEVFAENFAATSVALAAETKRFVSSILNLPIEKGYEMDRRLKADPNLLAEFIENPAEVSRREVGIEFPEGFHCHFVDENNVYYPPEGDALSQLSLGSDGRLWSRVEIRTAAGPGCYLFCGICGML